MKLAIILAFMAITTTILLIFTQLPSQEFKQSIRRKLQLTPTYLLMPEYFGAVVVALSFILVCGSLPIIFFLILCLSFTSVLLWIRNVCYSFRVWTQRRLKQKNLNNLKPISYIELKNVNPLTIEDTCVICLSIYNPLDQVISLPCNVAQSQGRTTTNHFFHAQCIHVWIQKQDNCPVCRKRFIQVDQQEE